MLKIKKVEPLKIDDCQCFQNLLSLKEWCSNLHMNNLFLKHDPSNQLSITNMDFVKDFKGLQVGGIFNFIFQNQSISILKFHSNSTNKTISIMLSYEQIDVCVNSSLKLVNNMIPIGWEIYFLIIASDKEIVIDNKYCESICKNFNFILTSCNDSSDFDASECARMATFELLMCYK